MRDLSLFQSHRLQIEPDLLVTRWMMGASLCSGWDAPLEAAATDGFGLIFEATDFCHPTFAEAQKAGPNFPTLHPPPPNLQTPAPLFFETPTKTAVSAK